MKEFIDYSGMKISEIKAASRNMLREDLINFLKTQYETVVPIGNTEIGVVTGTAPDDDGWLQDVVNVIKVSTKAWYSRSGEDIKREVKKFDLDAAAGGYEE